MVALVVWNAVPSIPNTFFHVAIGLHTFGTKTFERLYLELHMRKQT